MNLSAEEQNEFIEIFLKAKKEKQEYFMFYGNKVMVKTADHIIKHFFNRNPF